MFGNVIHTSPEDHYLARVVGINAGIPKESPALTLNRLCGSGLQAIVSAAQMIQTGDAEVALAGGAESMSRGAYWMESARWGARLGEASLVDSVVGALTDPFDKIHMGVTAENLASPTASPARRRTSSRSSRIAARLAAIEAGRFEEEIVPVEVKQRKGTVEFKVDEHARRDVSLEGLAKLKPAFRRGRHGDGRQCLRASTTLPRPWSSCQRTGERTGRACEGQDRFVRGMRSGAQDHGHRPRSRRTQGARASRQDTRPGRHRRAQRGVRGSGAGGP